MTATTDMVKQLNLLNEKAKPSSRQKISEAQWQKVYDQLVNVFSAVTPDERVELHMAFEDRDLLMQPFLQYLSKKIEQAGKLARRGRREDAVTVLQKGLVADAIIDGRASEAELDKLHNQIITLAQGLRFNLDSYLQSIETPVSAYIQRAYQFHKQGDRISAIRALGRALQLDHTMRRNPKIGEFAQALTGEDPYSAVITLEDSFTRNRFIDDLLERTGQSRTKKSSGQLSLIQRFLYGVFPGRRTS